MATRYATSARIQRHKFWRRMKLYGYVSGGLLAAVLIAYLLIGSPVFRINSILVVGGTTEDSQALIALLKMQAEQQGIGRYLGPDNYFSWDTSASYTSPTVSAISIDKSILSHSVTVTITPRQRFVVWCSDSQCWWVDQDGILFAPAPATEGQLVQAVLDDGPGSDFVLGQAVLEPDQFQNAKKIISAISSLRLGIAAVNVVRSLQELHVTTLSGTNILFSLRYDPQPAAIPALNKFIASPGLDKLQYLNLTVENRAFVKYR